MPTRHSPPSRKSRLGRTVQQPGHLSVGPTALEDKRWSGLSVSLLAAMCLVACGGSGQDSSATSAGDATEDAVANSDHSNTSHAVTAEDDAAVLADVQHRARALGAPGAGVSARSQLLVLARGSAVAGEYPVMEVRVNDQAIGQQTVANTQYRLYRFKAPQALAPGDRIDVVFLNDAYTDTEDRNLWVHSLLTWGARLKPNAQGVTYDRGSIDGQDVIPGQAAMLWGGALRFSIPASAPTPPASAPTPPASAPTPPASAPTPPASAPTPPASAPMPPASAPTPPAQGTPLPGTVHQGEGTFYGATGQGHCSFDPSPGNMMIAAMNHTDYANSAMCGGFIKLTGPKGTVTVKIVDECPECKPGDVDLSEEAFTMIAERSAGRVPISWQQVPGDVQGPVQYRYKEGSTRWWTAIQVRNHRYPITKLEILPTGATSWIQVPRTDYNYFVYATPIQPGPVQVRVTAQGGGVVQDQLPEPQGGVVTTGATQFP